MNILCDIDGVICQYDYADITERHFGFRVSYEDIFTYSLEKVMGVAEKDVYKMFLEEAQAPPRFIPGAIDGLNEILNSGNSIWIYSNRVHFMGEDGLLIWLKRHQIPFTAMYDPRETEEDCQPAEFEFHIDDCPQKLMDMGDTTVNKLLFDSPWNENCLNITGQLIRVKSWEEVLAKIASGKNGGSLRG